MKETGGGHSLGPTGQKIQTGDFRFTTELGHGDSKVTRHHRLSIPNRWTRKQYDLRMTSILNGQEKRSQGSTKAFGQQRHFALPGGQLRTITGRGRGKRGIVGGSCADLSHRYRAQFGQVQKDLRLTRSQYSVVGMSPDQCECNTREYSTKQSKS